MNPAHSNLTLAPAGPQVADLAAVAPNGSACWSAIGVYGDRTCPELAGVVHCRNCPTYSAAGAQLLSRDLTVEYRRERSEHFAKPRLNRPTTILSAVVFRLGPEWLALSTQFFQEVAERRCIHSLPHRRQGIVLGLVNVRGELLITVSLERLLGLEDLPGRANAAAPHDRLLVLNWDRGRLAFPVDEVHGPQRFRADELKAAPVTVAKTNPSFIQHVMYWRDRVVGLLDSESLFRSVNARLA